MELLSQARWDYGDASFQLNGQAQKHVIRSQLFQRLDGTAWVLDRGGRLKKPRAMTVETLPEGEECLKPVDVPGRGCTFPDHP